MYREQDLPSPNELRGDIFDFELTMLSRRLDIAGVEHVEVDEPYQPVDPEFDYRTQEEMFYDGFLTLHSFITIDGNEDEYVLEEQDIHQRINDRFDHFVDELSSNFIKMDDHKSAIMVQNLTMQGAAEFSKRKFEYYLSRFQNGQVKDRHDESQHAVNYMWGYLTLNDVARII